MDRVEYTLGATINMGDYNSAKIEVKYASDVRDKETPEKAFARTKALVEAEVESEIERMRESRA